MGAAEVQRDIVDVQLIRGGILAIAENEAALWDTVFARWLPKLDATPEGLSAGNAS